MVLWCCGAVVVRGVAVMVVCWWWCVGGGGLVVVLLLGATQTNVIMGEPRTDGELARICLTKKISFSSAPRQMEKVLSQQNV